jgi:hypothetical protein
MAMKLTLQLGLMRSARQSRGSRLASYATVRRSKREVLLYERNFPCLGLSRIQLLSAYRIDAGVHHLAIDIS